MRSFAFEGKGDRAGNVSLWVREVERSAPVDLGTCDFDFVKGLRARAIDVTYRATDRKGKIVGERKFAPRSCPRSVALQPGATVFLMEPASSDVSAWALALMK